jgi:predicted ribosome quality control (RQC) complex YloA/Tae2 family protein
MSEEEINILYLKIFAPKEKIREKTRSSFLKYKYNDVSYFVAKNSLKNYELVFKFALPNDIWFHAQNIPSAHLLLRKDSDVTDEELEIAAKIVSYFSKHSDENKVPVDYTYRKYVKKPKNTSLGFVIYDKFKTIIVKPFSEKELLKYL